MKLSIFIAIDAGAVPTSAPIRGLIVLFYLESDAVSSNKA
jgi:hypothetical protein